jgi:hypothetical protein
MDDRIGQILVVRVDRQCSGLWYILDIDLMDTGKRLVINRYEALVDQKFLEEQSFKVSIRDLLEFGAMKECANFTCIHCRSLESVQQNHQKEVWSTSLQERNARQQVWSETREREHFIHHMISGMIWKQPIQFSYAGLSVHLSRLFDACRQSCMKSCSCTKSTTSRNKPEI